MRALTLWRPWDQPVADGAKPVENRPNPPPRSLLGEVVAIHAGQKYDYDGAEFIKARGYRLLPHDGGRIGAIVGVARILGWVDQRRDRGRLATITCERDDLERLQAVRVNPWFFGPVGILLVDAVAIRPVKCRGMQGWWTVPEDVEKTVRERVEARRVA